MIRPHPLFVYGTLMRGQSHAFRLASARFVCDAQTVAGFALVDLGAYPGLVISGRGTVRGELFEVPASLLPALDEYEGHPELFMRSRIGLQGGRTAEAYVYREPGRRGLREIPSGDWRQRD